MSGQVSQPVMCGLPTKVAASLRIRSFSVITTVLVLQDLIHRCLELIYFHHCDDLTPSRCTSGNERISRI